MLSRPLVHQHHLGALKFGPEKSSKSHTIVAVRPAMGGAQRLLHRFDPRGQGVVPAARRGRVVGHGFYHREALDAVPGSFAHLNEGQPVAFAAVANDLVDVPRT